MQPEQGATDVDTKETVSLFFNQSIDADLLTVNLYETAYGKTWINEDDAGTEFFNAQGQSSSAGEFDEFKAFPCYRTFFKIGLSAKEANALSQLWAWPVSDSQSPLSGALADFIAASK